MDFQLFLKTGFIFHPAPRSNETESSPLSCARFVRVSIKVSTAMSIHLSPQRCSQSLESLRAAEAYGCVKYTKSPQRRRKKIEVKKKAGEK